MISAIFSSMSHKIDLVADDSIKSQLAPDRVSSPDRKAIPDCHDTVANFLDNLEGQTA